MDARFRDLNAISMGGTSNKGKNRDKELTAAAVELIKGMAKAKCRKCGCMLDALKAIHDASLRGIEIPAELEQDVKKWLQQMEATAYSCLGCKHCHGAEAVNLLEEILPEVVGKNSCGFALSAAWPPAPGEYFVVGSGSDRPVIVSTLASTELAAELARLKPKGLCLVGKTETENIGIDKVIKNTITNPDIKVMVIAGHDPEGHRSGATLLSLFKNGVDEKGRVKGSQGRRPVLKNTTLAEVEAFRDQVQVVDLIGNVDAKPICERIELAASTRSEIICSCTKGGDQAQQPLVEVPPVIQASAAKKAELDKAGYFVIIPRAAENIITVEHYTCDNTLLRTIEGHDAKSVYSTIIRNGWVSSLSHAAYLGKELSKAELSMQMGFKYVQDGA